jgi:pre-mRNA-processing factor 17
MDAIASYSGESEGEDYVQPESFKRLTAAINSAPAVDSKRELLSINPVDPATKEIEYNPKYEQLAAPIVGPENPFLTKLQAAAKNTLTGYVERADLNDFQFEAQRRTFHSYGYALDPSVDANNTVQPKYIGEVEKAEAVSGLTVFESSKSRPGDKRKRLARGTADDVEGFRGPWAGFEDEEKIAKPSEEEQAILDEQFEAKTKVPKKEEKEEKTTLHIKDPFDYQGRSFLHIPQDVDVDLRAEDPPEKCFIPKKHIHTWTGHTKGVAAIRLFPQSGHLLLSCGMDSKLKLWEVYHERRCIRTYLGHRQAVRDACFNNDGSQFLSAGFDRFVKLWDTETGECLGRFTSRKVAYCVKFNPDEDKQHLFVVGQSDKKLVTWDIRSGEIVQEYDRHLGAVNTATFIDQNRRIVTTSDDKTIRVWEW